MRLGNGWREWSASARSCARKTTDLRTTFRDGRYGPLQPTAVAEMNSLNDRLGEKSGNTIDLSSDNSMARIHVAHDEEIKATRSHCPQKRLIWVTGSDAVFGNFL